MTEAGFTVLVSDVSLCAVCVHVSHAVVTQLSDLPFPSARQHPSYGDCLAVKREYYQNMLQWVPNVAACVVSGTGKFDRGMTQLHLSELHWLDVPGHIQYKLGVCSPVSSKQGAPVPRGLLHTYF